MRRIDADTVLEVLKAPPLSVAPGTEKAVCFSLKIDFERLAFIQDKASETHTRIDQLMVELTTSDDSEAGINWQRDVAILSSIPGVGRIILATLLAEASELLQNRDYQALRCLCGIATITKRSGKSNLVMRRLACNARLRNAVHYWSQVAVQHDEVTKTKYSTLRDRGHSHARALRSIGDRLLNVACAMLKHQTEFNHKQRSYQKAA